MVLHLTALERFQNLERAYARLQKEIHSADLADFLTKANHLAEAIEKDASSTQQQIGMVVGIRASRWWKLSNELSNDEKHLKLKQGNIKQASIRRGYGAGRWGVGDWGVGEQSIDLELTDGTSVDALILIENIINLYRPVFS